MLLKITKTATVPIICFEQCRKLIISPVMKAVTESTASGYHRRTVIYCEI
jgi:hypothetical protein